MSAPFIFTLSLYLAIHAIAITSSHYPKMQLVHKDELFSSNQSTNNRHHIDAQIKRDSIRVVTLNRLLMNDTIVVATTTLSIGSNVISGIDFGTGEYLVRIGVGSPPRYQYLVIDTGSDLLWIQCQPCQHCYHQFDPIFDPSGSTSYITVVCNSRICNRAGKTSCHADGCNYIVNYGDKSFTTGTLAIETITFDQAVILEVAIGCGHSNEGLFSGYAGVLGLGRGSMSLLDQLAGSVGGAFTYCLGSPGSSYGSGYLVFGRQEFPTGARWTPLVFNQWKQSSYYVELLGLIVGDTLLSIPEAVFKLDKKGNGGVILDTGTVVTRLATTAYVALRDAFIAKTANLPRISSPVPLFDTCYDFSGFSTDVQLPAVYFYFPRGFGLELGGRSILIPMEQQGVYCFAFAPSLTSLSIIGNIHQRGIQISIDSSNGYVGFGPNHC